MTSSLWFFWEYTTYIVTTLLVVFDTEMKPAEPVAGTSPESGGASSRKKGTVRLCAKAALDVSARRQATTKRFPMENFNGDIAIRP